MGQATSTRKERLFDEDKIILYFQICNAHFFGKVE